MRKKFSTTLQIILFIGFLVLIYAGVLALIDKNILVVDERDSWGQIVMFTRQNWVLSENITSMRGWHAVVALISRLVGRDDISNLRYIGVIINLLVFPAFYFAGRALKLEGLGLRILLLAFAPLFFPFYMLLYTDLFSLFFVITSFIFAWKKSYIISSLFAFAGLFVRQTNIVWLVFSNIILFLKSGGLPLNGQKIKRHFVLSLPYLAAAVLFAGFIYVNKGAAMGQKEIHPLTVSNLGNVYFVLFLYVLLFLIDVIGNMRKILKLLIEKKIIVALGLVLLVFYLLTYQNLHMFNQSEYFIRNRILVFFDSNIALKTLYFLVAFLGVLSLSVTKLKAREFYLLYPFTFLSLIPMTLIEERYYMTPLALFLLFREKTGGIKDGITLVYWIIISLIIFEGAILKGRYFL